MSIAIRSEICKSNERLSEKLLSSGHYVAMSDGCCFRTFRSKSSRPSPAIALLANSTLPGYSQYCGDYSLSNIEQSSSHHEEAIPRLHKGQMEFNERTILPYFCAAIDVQKSTKAVRQKLLQAGINKPNSMPTMRVENLETLRPMRPPRHSSCDNLIAMDYEHISNSTFQHNNVGPAPITQFKRSTHYNEALINDNPDFSHHKHSPGDVCKDDTTTSYLYTGHINGLRHIRYRCYKENRKSLQVPQMPRNLETARSTSLTNLDDIKDDCRYLSEDAAIYVDTGKIHCPGREYILGRLSVDETPNIDVNKDLPDTVKKRLLKILTEFEGNGSTADELSKINKHRLSMPEHMHKQIQYDRRAFRALSLDQSFEEHAGFQDSRRITLREKVGSCIDMLKSKLLHKATISHLPFPRDPQKDCSSSHPIYNTANYPILLKTIITLNKIEPPINRIEESSNFNIVDEVRNLEGPTVDFTSKRNQKAEKNKFDSKCKKICEGKETLVHTKSEVFDGTTDCTSIEKEMNIADIPITKTTGVCTKNEGLKNSSDVGNVFMARAELNSQMALDSDNQVDSSGPERVTDDASDRKVTHVLKNTMSKLRKIRKRYSKTLSNIDLGNDEPFKEDTEHLLQATTKVVLPSEITTTCGSQTCDQPSNQKPDVENLPAQKHRASTHVWYEPDHREHTLQSSVAVDVELPTASRKPSTLISSIKALAARIGQHPSSEITQPQPASKGYESAITDKSSTVFFVGPQPEVSDVCMMRLENGDLLVTETTNNSLNIATGDVIYEINGHSVRQMKGDSIKRMLQTPSYRTMNIGYYCNRNKFKQTGQTRRRESLLRPKMNYSNASATEDDSIQSIHSYKSNITPRSTIVQRRPGNATPNIMTRVSHSVVSSGGVMGGMHLPFSGGAFSGLAGLASGMGIPLRSSAKGASSGGHAMVAINETREREKRELSHLNDKFAQYVEKVRFLEAQNRKLQLELEALQNKAGHGSSRIKEMYEVEMQEAKKLIDDTLKDKAISEVKAQNAENQSNNFKKRYQEMMMTRGSDRQQLDQLEQEIAENEAKINLLRRRLSDLEDECRRYKTETQRLLSEISRLTNELNNEVFAKSSLETEKMALEDELQMLKTMHEAELNELKSRTNLDVGLDPSQFFRNELANAIKEIRNEYELANEQQRSDLHQKYMIHYNELVLRYQKPEVDPIQYEHQRLQEEKMRASLSCARSEVNQMKTRNEDLAQRIRDVQLMLNQEKDDARHMSAVRDHELDELRGKLEQLLKEYDEVSSMKTSLEKEISEYRELLEGTSNHDGLRQVVEHIEEEARRLESERGLENISNAAASVVTAGNRGGAPLSYFSSRSVTSHSSGSPIASAHLLPTKQYPAASSSSTSTVQSSFNRNFSNAVSSSRDF